MKDNAIAANDTNDTTLDIEEVSLVEASDTLGDLVLNAAVNNTRFLLTRKGKDAAAIIGPRDIARLAGRPGVFEEVPSSEARRQLGRLVVQASLGKKRYLILRYGSGSAGLVGIEDLDYLRTLDPAA